MLEIKDLYVDVEGKALIKGLSLTLRAGEVHVLMGPNGAGKSTIGKVLSGDSAYEITAGDILFKGTSILDLSPEERAHLGIFLGFQYPVEVPGISNTQFLHAAHSALAKARGKGVLNAEAFHKLLDEKIALVEMKAEFALRNVNEGFSGGEKKRNEILQMAVLEPKLAILDETDSGLDIDALRIVAKGINRLLTKDNALLLITHYQRLLEYITPHFIHVVVDGKIVMSGGPELALELEKKGYDWLSPQEMTSC